MAKELPYFKFDCAQWISGGITLEDLQTQGAFINICAYYWFKSGDLTLSEIKRRVKLKQPTINRLVESGVIKVDGDYIKISFLDQQFEERQHVSRRNSENAKKGGAPKGNLNAKKEEKNNRPLSEKQPKTTNIEEEQNKKENKNMSTTVDDSLEVSILEIIRSLKSEYLNRPVKEYKLTAKRKRQVLGRKKDFDKLWPGRDFKKACLYAFTYKADEWFGTDMFRFFDPDTLLSEKFVSYLEKAEQDKGQPYTADKPKEEKIVYRING